MTVHHLKSSQQDRPTAGSEAESSAATNAPPLPFWGLIWRNARHSYSAHILPTLREAGTYRSIAAGLVVAATALVATPLAVASLILGLPALIQAALAVVALIGTIAAVEFGLTRANKILTGAE